MLRTLDARFADASAAVVLARSTEARRKAAMVDVDVDTEPVEVGDAEVQTTEVREAEVRVARARACAREVAPTERRIIVDVQGKGDWDESSGRLGPRGEASVHGEEEDNFGSPPSLGGAAGANGGGDGLPGVGGP